MVSSGRIETGEPVVRQCEMLNEAATGYRAVALSSRMKEGCQQEQARAPLGMYMPLLQPR